MVSRVLVQRERHRLLGTGFSATKRIVGLNGLLVEAVSCLEMVGFLVE